jgi:hypothetical protein
MRARSFSLLIAVTAALLALAAAGVASAEDNAPVDANGKKACVIHGANGSLAYVPHGSEITVDGPLTGSKITLRCEDGEWKVRSTRVVTPTTPLRTYQLVTADLGSATVQARG